MFFEYKCDLCEKKPDFASYAEEGEMAWRYIIIDQTALLFCDQCGTHLKPGGSYSFESKHLTDDIRNAVISKKAKANPKPASIASETMIKSLL